MRYYLVKDQIKQGQFGVFWKMGKDNLAEYFTKFHSPAYHIKMRATYPVNPLQTRMVCSKGVLSGTHCRILILHIRNKEEQTLLERWTAPSNLNSYNCRLTKFSVNLNNTKL